jgi:hypothetical protein
LGGVALQEPNPGARYGKKRGFSGMNIQNISLILGAELPLVNLAFTNRCTVFEISHSMQGISTTRLDLC